MRLAGFAVVVALLAGPALGADDEPVADVESSPAADTADTPDTPDDAPEEGADDAAGADADIVVYGEHLAAQARAKVERELVAQGYDRVIEKDGYLLYRHEEVWKGEVRVYDDGWVRLRRQPIQFRPPEGSPLGWATCIAVPFCVRTRGQTVSQAKLTGHKRRALARVDPLSRQWGDRVADLHVDRSLVALADQLEALWDDGAPLDPNEAPLATPDARKAALLDYWESRTDTIWGDRVRAGVEAFVREVVQFSPFAFTDAEIAAFNARRTCEAELDLDRPWAQVVAELEARAGQ